MNQINAHTAHSLKEGCVFAHRRNGDATTTTTTPTTTFVSRDFVARSVGHATGCRRRGRGTVLRGTVSRECPCAAAGRLPQWVMRVLAATGVAESVGSAVEKHVRGTSAGGLISRLPGDPDGCHVGGIFAIVTCGSGDDGPELHQKTRTSSESLISPPTSLDVALSLTLTWLCIPSDLANFGWKAADM